MSRHHRQGPGALLTDATQQAEWYQKFMEAFIKGSSLLDDHSPEFARGRCRFIGLEESSFRQLEVPSKHINVRRRAEAHLNPNAAAAAYAEFLSIKGHLII